MGISDRIIAYENGEIDGDELVDFFQDLIDSGMVWKLQSLYGQTAHALIGLGWCHK